MWINTSALSEWHSATFSTVHERESSRPQWQFSVCSRFANHERITAQTWISSSQFSVWVVAVPLPAGMLATELSWTEKGTNQFMKWFPSLRSLKKMCSFEQNICNWHNTTVNLPYFALYNHRAIFNFLSFLLSCDWEITPATVSVTSLQGWHPLLLRSCSDPDNYQQLSTVRPRLYGDPIFSHNFHWKKPCPIFRSIRTVMNALTVATSSYQTL